jgi:heptaprenyl diphosphate synthase/octaprenyl-diphosphate synthase
MAELFAAGGKRLRPALVLLFAKLGEYDYDRDKHGAMAVEFMHAATLVHDDVIDRSQLRRGRPTVAAARGAEAAILVGDYYFAKAYLEAAAAGRAEVVTELARAVTTMCDGELQAQKELHLYHRHVGNYFSHIAKKTGALLEAACRIGAVLGGLDAAGIAAASFYGRDLGFAFQIVDDVLDYIGDEESLGKPVGHDLLEGIATLPLLNAFETSQRDRLDALVEDGKPLDPGRVEQIVAIVRESGMPERALAVAAGWAADAAEILAQNLPDSEPRQVLAELASYVVERKL